MVEVVWFKRDLRIVDHRPLIAAVATGAPVVCLYIAEPDLWAQTCASARHWLFIQESLQELRHDLLSIGGTLVIRTGDTVSLLDRLHRQVGISGIWSHEETGNGWTYSRDKEVAAWARGRAVPWHEFPQSGVERPRRTRDGWASRWDRKMRASIVPAPAAVRSLPGLDPGSIPSVSDLGLAPDDCPGRQPGGRSAGLDLLRSFLNDRGATYHREMSSPLTADTACSRLSAHLAYGTLSMREVAQATWGRLAEVKAMPAEVRGAQATALRAYIGRLHWHCHFIQKLEASPSLEFANLHRAYDGLRENEFDQTLFRAWAAGRTGFPFVDACMRSLASTGWINFRMRAMLVAFASYQLWLHWRETGLHLARLFTDYEPGIHWPQMQMQSGTTGTNTVRIYNPVKQSTDQDPEGTFIRRWIPELRGVPGSFIHEPWRMPEDMQNLVSCVIGTDYPSPIVDHEVAARRARERVWAVRRGDAFRSEARAILIRHGSRKQSSVPLRGRSSRAVAPQATHDLAPVTNSPQLTLDLSGGDS